DAGAAN
ncbi:hypothetical protein AB1N83_013996, partial [Pleurotus pulmonarius]